MKADFIPNGSDRGHRSWFASDHGHWLYWEGKASGHQRSHVGPMIRPTIEMLAAAGCMTTHSSQGRIWTEEVCKTTYKAIIDDIRRVRKGGLTLHNVATLGDVVWQDPEATAPWTSWEQLKSTVTQGGRGKKLRDSRRGYLGVVNQWEDPDHIVSALNAHLPDRKGHEVIQGRNAIGVYVREPDPDLWLDVHAAWKYALTIADPVKDL